MQLGPNVLGWSGFCMAHGVDLHRQALPVLTRSGALAR